MNKRILIVPDRYEEEKLLLNGILKIAEQQRQFDQESIYKKVQLLINSKRNPLLSDTALDECQQEIKRLLSIIKGLSDECHKYYQRRGALSMTKIFTIYLESSGAITEDVLKDLCVTTLN